MLHSFKSKKRFRPFLALEITLNAINHCVARRNSRTSRQIAILSFDHIGIVINQFGAYEKSLMDDVMAFLIKNKLLKKGTFIDIGANIGCHSINFSKISEEVLAFEPIPITYELLKVNTSCFDNIHCKKLAISSKKSTAIMSINKANMGGSRISSKERGSFEVKTDTIDCLLKDYKKSLSLIKIDTEGHEIEVLRGSKEMIKKNMPVILLEQDSKEINNGSSESIDFLKSLGYSFYDPKLNFDFRPGIIKKIAINTID